MLGNVHRGGCHHEDGTKIVGVRFLPGVARRAVAAQAPGGIVPVKTVLKAGDYARRIQTLSAIGTVHFRGAEGMGCWVFVVEDSATTAARAYELRGGGHDLYEDGVRARVFGIVHDEIETPCGLPIVVVRYYRILAPMPAYGVMLPLIVRRTRRTSGRSGRVSRPVTDGPIRLEPPVLYGVLGVVNQTRFPWFCRLLVESAVRFPDPGLQRRGGLAVVGGEGVLTVMGRGAGRSPAVDVSGSGQACGPGRASFATGNLHPRGLDDAHPGMPERGRRRGADGSSGRRACRRGAVQDSAGSVDAAGRVAGARERTSAGPFAVVRRFRPLAAILTLLPGEPAGDSTGILVHRFTNTVTCFGNPRSASAGYCSPLLPEAGLGQYVTVLPNVTTQETPRLCRGGSRSLTVTGVI